MEGRKVSFNLAGRVPGKTPSIAETLASLPRVVVGSFTGLSRVGSGHPTPVPVLTPPTAPGDGPAPGWALDTQRRAGAPYPSPCGRPSRWRGGTAGAVPLEGGRKVAGG